MIDWVDHSFLATLFGTLTGVQVVVDPAAPEPFVNPSVKCRIMFDVRASQALGWDDFVREFDTGLNRNVVTQDANRLFVIYVKAESFVPTIHAEDILETLRLKLFRPSVLAQLREKNMTATSAETTVSLPTSYDSRVISAASLDIHMALRRAGEDETDDGNWVETFDLDYDDA